MNVNFVRVRSRLCGIGVGKLRCNTGLALDLHVEYGALCLSRFLGDASFVCSRDPGLISGLVAAKTVEMEVQVAQEEVARIEVQARVG
jgi:hypothetical protein